MSEPFLGQIQPFGFNFAPRGWAKCDGQLLQIASYSALFSLLGTTYGGDGRSTFGLPDLRGRTSLHMGTGPGLTPRTWGARGGQERVTLTVAELASHNHSLHASAEGADRGKPEGNEIGSSTIFHAATTDATLAAASIGHTGGGQSHENMPPFLVINWCIALVGIFPSRN